MKRGFSFVAVRGIEPQTFAVAPRRLVAEVVQEIHKGYSFDSIYIHRLKPHFAFGFGRLLLRLFRSADGRSRHITLGFIAVDGHFVSLELLKILHL